MLDECTLTVEGIDDHAPTHHGKKGIVTHTDLKIKDVHVRDEGRLVWKHMICCATISDGNTSG